MVIRKIWWLQYIGASPGLKNKKQNLLSQYLVHNFSFRPI